MLQYGAANTHAGQYRHRSLQREDSTTPTALKWLPVLFIPFAVLVPDALAARDPKIERPVGADVSGVSSRMEPCSMQFFCPSLQSDSTVRQSDSQTVRHSDTQTLRQSDSQTVRQSDTQTLRHSDSVACRGADGAPLLRWDDDKRRPRQAVHERVITQSSHLQLLHIIFNPNNLKTSTCSQHCIVFNDEERREYC